MGDWYKVDRIAISHEDNRRSLTAIFNGDFVAQQVKMLKIKRDSVLGNHYHNYREMFYIVEGKARFYLEDVLTGERADIYLNRGGRLLIEPKIAHKVEMKEGTLTIEATESPYISPEYNDVRYEIKWANGI